MLRVPGASLKNPLYLADLRDHMWPYGTAVRNMFWSQVSRFPLCSSGISFLLSKQQEKGNEGHLL